MFKGKVPLGAGLLALGMLLGTTAAPVAAQETEMFSGFTITSATVDPRTGEIVVSGTVTCARTGLFFVGVSMRQQAGRVPIYGGAWAEVQCNEVGQVVAFTATGGSDGKFTPGRVDLFVEAYGECSEFHCEFQFLGDMTIRLRRP